MLVEVEEGGAGNKESKARFREFEVTLISVHGEERVASSR